VSARTLVLLRHAKSDWDGHEADIDRPLARRGQREAPEAGQWIGGHLPPIELAVVSPARRANETWQLVAAQLGRPTVVQVENRVYAASAATLLSVVRDLPPEVCTALLVGHNPGLEELVLALTGELVPMPTSAIAVLAVDVEWSAVNRAVLAAAGRPPVPRA
jgi:phosphohistidine phosphatase